MKTILTIAIIGWMSLSIFAQTPPNTKPQFTGGDKALVDFINNTMRYPDEAQKQRWEGKALIAFTVNEDGTLANVRALKSSSFIVLDNEALRIVKMMPKWIPATENGVNKKEMVVLPIVFDLSRKDILFK
ncbi:MAG: energy transducer TonB [Chitinophagales bacterium]